MIANVMLVGLLVGAQPAASAPLDSFQGMAATYHSAASDPGARRLCLTERATGRTICRRTDAWRALNRKLEAAARR